MNIKKQTISALVVFLLSSILVAQEAKVTPKPAPPSKTYIYHLNLKEREIAENYLQKGNKVAIEGKLVHRVYDDSEGNKKYITEVIANSVMMLDSKPKT